MFAFAFDVWWLCKDKSLKDSFQKKIGLEPPKTALK